MTPKKEINKTGTFGDAILPTAKQLSSVQYMIFIGTCVLLINDIM